MLNSAGRADAPTQAEIVRAFGPADIERHITERTKAIVVIKEAQRGKVSEQDIIAWAHANMAAYKSPRLVEFVESLPKSATGKVMWRALQEKEAAGG